MKYSRLLGTVCTLVVGIVTVLAVRVTPVTDTANIVQSRASEFNLTENPFSGASIPSSDFLSAINDSSGTKNINYSRYASRAIFTYDFARLTHNIIAHAAAPDFVHSNSQFLYFTATSGAAYLLGGFYTLSDSLKYLRTMSC